MHTTWVVDIAASCRGVDTPLPLSDTFLRIFDRIFRRIFSKWAQLTWARALQRLVLETWYAREIDPWTRKHCQKQNRQIKFWDWDESESVSQNAGKENSAAIVSGSRKPVLPFKLAQKILPLKKRFFPHHTILTTYLRKPCLIFLGQKDGTGGPVSSSNYCPINGRFTFSLTREDQVSRVGRTRILHASLGDPVRLNFCKGTKALMTLSANAIWIFSVFWVYFSFRSESRCAQPKVVRGGR